MYLLRQAQQPNRSGNQDRYLASLSFFPKNNTGTFFVDFIPSLGDLFLAEAVTRWQTASPARRNEFDDENSARRSQILTGSAKRTNPLRSRAEFRQGLALERGPVTDKVCSMNRGLFLLNFCLRTPPAAQQRGI